MVREVLFWLAAVLFFIGAEAGTAQLVSFWFIGGSLAALIAALCSAPWWLQVALFLSVSLLMLLSLRPIFLKYVKPKTVATNVDGNIGKVALVTELIDNVHQVGAVKLGGTTWSARSLDGRTIEPETLVVIRKIEGVKVFVEPAEATVHQ